MQRLSRLFFALSRPVLHSPTPAAQRTRYTTTSPFAPKEVDVAIVGSGAGGLTAAVTAALHGLKVLVVEKTNYYGGTTAYSGGGVWIPCNKHQAERGISDSIQEAEKYIRNAYPDYDIDYAKLRAYLTKGPEMVRWIEDNTHMKFEASPVPDYHAPAIDGYSSVRTITTKDFDGRKLGRRVKEIRYPLQGFSAFGSLQVNPLHAHKLLRPLSSTGNMMFGAQTMGRYLIDLIQYGKGTALANGNAMVGRLLFSALEANVEFWRNSPALSLIREQGTATGLNVLKEGIEVTIKAKNGIVIASGGFGRSPETRKFLKNDWTAVPRGNEGDGIRMARDIGAHLPKPGIENSINAAISFIKPLNGPVRRFPHLADMKKPGSIVVDESGRRFANESQPYQEYGNAYHRAGVKRAFFIADKKYVKKYGMGYALPFPYPTLKIMRQNYFIRAPTVRQLATKLNIDPDALQSTVDRFNKYARQGRDPDFHRGESGFEKFFGDPFHKPNTCLRSIEEGSLFAIPVYAGNVSTLNGLSCDKNAQVLDNDLKPIKGLYAVGCDHDNVMRGAYPGGGTSLGPAMTYGYLAAKHLVGDSPCWP